MYFYQTSLETHGSAVNYMCYTSHINLSLYCPPKKNWHLRDISESFRSLLNNDGYRTRRGFQSVAVEQCFSLMVSIRLIMYFLHLNNVKYGYHILEQLKRNVFEQEKYPPIKKNKREVRIDVTSSLWFVLKVWPICLYKNWDT